MPDQISRNLKRAIIAFEDANFVNNNGYQTDAILQAWERNKTRSRIVWGGSTISQQLARNLFLSREKSYIRKAQELVITCMLEFWMDKERILEIYLNSVEWGNGVYGAEAAAQHYYETSAAKLTAWQGARLAVMLPRPEVLRRPSSTTTIAIRPICCSAAASSRGEWGRLSFPNSYLVGVAKHYKAMIRQGFFVSCQLSVARLSPII